jgi:hypothetical protein
MVRNFKVQNGAPNCPMRKCATSGDRRDSMAIAAPANAIKGRSKVNMAIEATTSSGLMKLHIPDSRAIRQETSSGIAEWVCIGSHPMLSRPASASFSFGVKTV